MILYLHCVFIERLRLMSQCSALPVPPTNGYLCSDLAAPLVGQVEFCCDLGYQLVGSSTAVCDTATGTWEPDPPTCQRKYTWAYRRFALDWFVTCNIPVHLYLYNCSL